MFIGTPRGAFTPIPKIFLELPPRVFLGILSEYQALKYGPELVNMTFGKFLVSVYIVYRYPPVVHAQGSKKIFLYIFMQPFRASLNIPRKSLEPLVLFFGGSRGERSVPPSKIQNFFYLTLDTPRGIIGFCTNNPPMLTQMLALYFWILPRTTSKGF